MTIYVCDIYNFRIIAEENTNLYVYGFGAKWEVDELFFYRTFAPFGAIASIKVMMDLQTGYPKGMLYRYSGFYLPPVNLLNVLFLHCLYLLLFYVHFQ